MHVRTAALVASFVVVAAAAHAQAAADTGQKSAALAGVTSYFLPGLGSWYAGNNDHALAHGAVALGLGLVATGVSVVGDCTELACPHEASNAVLGVVLIAYLTNQIWSTVTAVRDAQAYNDAARLRTARLDLAPAVRIAASPGDVARWRVEVRVLRLEF